MTSREIIRRNLEGAGPERIGLTFSGERMNDIRGDIVDPSATWTEKRWVEGNVEYYDDEFGNIWHRIVGMSQSGEIFRPVLDDWAKLDDIQFPDLGNPARFQRAAQSFAGDKERYRLGGLPGFPFAVCRYLRKMEIYLQDLVVERDRVDRLHDRVTTLLEAEINGWANIGADGVFFCEDWGIQDRLLVSPAMWRDIFKPLYARLCKAAHARSLHVLMHSCGYNWHILDDLAEVGINAFHFDQPDVYGLESLAGKLHELRVCLWSGPDIQQVMPTGDRARIESVANRMVDLFEGWFIAKNYSDLPGIGVEPEWDDWAYQVFLSRAMAATAGARV